MRAIAAAVLTLGLGFFIAAPSSAQTGQQSASPHTSSPSGAAGAAGASSLQRSLRPGLSGPIAPGTGPVLMSVTPRPSEPVTPSAAPALGHGGVAGTISPSTGSVGESRPPVMPALVPDYASVARAIYNGCDGPALKGVDSGRVIMCMSEQAAVRCGEAAPCREAVRALIRSEFGL